MSPPRCRRAAGMYSTKRGRAAAQRPGNSVEDSVAMPNRNHTVTPQPITEENTPHPPERQQQRLPNGRIAGPTVLAVQLPPLQAVAGDLHTAIVAGGGPL